MDASSSRKPQVFINFRGADVRNNFVVHLHRTLRSHGINAFIDNDLQPGVKLKELFEKIEESTVALAILSSKYTESHWCLDELVKIKECVDRGTLSVIPIFYKLETSIVKNLEGSFGLQLWNLWREKERDDRILKWDAALQDAGGRMALLLKENSNEVKILDEIKTHIQNVLSKEERLREKSLRASL